VARRTVLQIQLLAGGNGVGSCRRLGAGDGGKKNGERERGARRQ
jgi:hypothetical protein